MGCSHGLQFYMLHSKSFYAINVSISWLPSLLMKASLLWSPKLKMMRFTVNSFPLVLPHSNWYLRSNHSQSRAQSPSMLFTLYKFQLLSGNFCGPPWLYISCLWKMRWIAICRLNPFSAFSHSGHIWYIFHPFLSLKVLPSLKILVKMSKLSPIPLRQNLFLSLILVPHSLTTFWLGWTAWCVLLIFGCSHYSSW